MRNFPVSVLIILNCFCVLKKHKTMEHLRFVSIFVDASTVDAVTADSCKQTVTVNNTVEY